MLFAPLLLVALPLQVSDAAAGDGLTAAHQHPVQHLVTIQGAPLELLRLARLDLDTISSKLAEGEVIALVDEAEIDQIQDLGLRVDVEIDDLARHYAGRLAADQAGSASTFPGTAAAGAPYGQWLSPALGQGGMGGYYTYAEIVAVLDQMAAAYPALVAPKVSLGDSLEGRPIWMVKISDNPGSDESEPEVRIDSLHHAREPQGMQTTLYFMSYLLEEYGTDPVATYLVNEREIYFVPCVNPDGYEFNRSQAPGGGGLWRKNRRSNGGGSFGVDLNRNYPFQWAVAGSSNNPDSETYHGPSATSEPETQAMTQFIASRSFRTALSVHTFSDLWLAPWGYVPQFPPAWPEMQIIGDAAAADNGYVHGPAAIVLYEAAGTTIDYDYGTYDTYSWTPEIGSSSDGFWPAQSRILPLAEENRLAFARTALAAGAWLRPAGLIATEEGDMDGVFEPGEDVVIDVFVQNAGRDDSPSAQVFMSVASPFALITDDDSTISANSFQTAQNTAPLRFVIDPQTPVGTVLPVTVTVTAGDLVFDIEGEIQVGAVTIAAFDFEASGNEGWSVGAPNDATTGEWTRADPIGTAAQPENDFTDGAGTRCWFTGQGSSGGSLGENDVDGGSTTLVSPVFDLSGASAATLSYALWYSNDEGSSANDDIFQVDLSTDGGVSWVSADVVGPAGPGTSGGWREISLDLGALGALSSGVRVRFIATDSGPGSIVEAALDDVRITGIVAPNCVAPVVYCPLTPNNWTAGAEIDAVGSTDVTQNSLTLTVSGANPNGFGLFLYGLGRAQSSVGNGNLCIASSFTRLPAVVTDASGFGTYAIDFPTLSTPVQNGETWSFQYWLRDVGGAGSNFSNAVEIVFCEP